MKLNFKWYDEIDDKEKDLEVNIMKLKGKHVKAITEEIPVLLNKNEIKELLGLIDNLEGMPTGDLILQALNKTSIGVDLVYEVVALITKVDVNILWELDIKDFGKIVNTLIAINEWEGLKDGLKNLPLLKNLIK